MFCHVEWNRIKADIELQPLPPHTRHLVERLLKNEWISPFQDDIQAEIGALDRLGLVYFDGEECDDDDDDDGDTQLVDGVWFGTDLLFDIEARGLLDELLGDRR